MVNFSGIRPGEQNDPLDNLVGVTPEMVYHSDPNPLPSDGQPTIAQGRPVAPGSGGVKPQPAYGVQPWSQGSGQPGFFNPAQAQPDSRLMAALADFLASQERTQTSPAAPAAPEQAQRTSWAEKAPAEKAGVDFTGRPLSRPAEPVPNALGSAVPPVTPVPAPEGPPVPAQPRGEPLPEGEPMPTRPFIGDPGDSGEFEPVEA